LSQPDKSSKLEHNAQKRAGLDPGFARSMTAERLIHILPEQVASQIAAGEVVERPASALKELVENSLDAGARTISIEIMRGGGELISVSDDGCGMTREDAIISLRRHATSKLRDAAGLGAITTLGFRGEALAAVASVSHLRLRTRRAADPHGVELRAEAGEIETAQVCAMAPGTALEVRELFFNTPARLKFLKTVATEQSAAAEAVQRLALANPSVAFSLRADGRMLLDLPRAKSLRERMRQLFGARLADRMRAFAAGQSHLRVSGLAAMSQESFPTPRLVFTFVNRRAVRDRMLARAVMAAYQTLIPRGRHPAVALFVEVKPEEVDVNVHPMKTEVRFRHSGAVFEAVYHALRQSLADQSDDADATVQPPSDSREFLNAQSSVGERPLRLVADTLSVMVQRPLAMGFRREDAPAQIPLQSLDTASVDAAAPTAASVPLYSRLRILGQIFAGYIALEHDDGLILVDQHAAHERVTFERLRAELRTGGIRVQAMLTPATLELAPARAAAVMESLAELRAMGFETEPFGPTTLLVKGAPAVFGAEGGLRLLGEMIEAMGENGFGMRGENAFEDLLKQLACHGSIRAGRALEYREMAELLAELDATEFKANCPHGRPVHIQFARGQIERMFRR
jgi:DNA mismatch repair protein MutL